MNYFELMGGSPEGIGFFIISSSDGRGSPARVLQLKCRNLAVFILLNRSYPSSAKLSGTIGCGAEFNRQQSGAAFKFVANGGRGW